MSSVESRLRVGRLVVVAAGALSTGQPFVALAAEAADDRAGKERKESANNRVLEEIVVQARRQDETLQDVPVSITSVGAEQLVNFQLDQPQEIAERIPNFNIATGGSGSGGTLNLRGVGSSAISAAFDSAVALDIDGIQVARMRMVQSAFLDLAQVDVLKGPQSLYFGKSASAGVVAFRSADPTDTWEYKLSGGLEFEQEGNFVDGYVSGPLTDTLGARVAFRYSEADDFWGNSAPGASDDEFGERNLAYRVTLAWDPSDNFSANLKSTYTELVADNAIGPHDIWCPGGTPQSTNFAGATWPAGYDCKDDDGVVQLADPNPVHGANFTGFENYVPFEELDTNITRLQLDWLINDKLTLTSVTGYFDLAEKGGDSYGYDGNGFGTNWTENTTEAFSQEFRLAGDLGERTSFLLGAFYQDRELVFNSAQHAIGAAQFASGIFGNAADPITGLTSDWRKVHSTDSETTSVFASVTVNVTDRLELTAGARYSEEERSQVIDVPELHNFFKTFPPFVPLFSGIDVGFNSGNIDFEDDQVTPEFSALFALTDEVNLFAAYKTGYKAGGIDNSALPSASLATAASSGDFSSLVFDSEVGEGFEVGMKGRFLEGSLRLDVTAYRYVYEDLQVQTFNAQTVQFNTENAGEVTSQGLEVDFTWLPNIEGMTLYGALSFLDAEFTAPFTPEPPAGITDPAIIAQYDLKGRATSGAADVAFNVGLDYARPFGDYGLEWGYNLNTSYTDEYETQNEDPVGHIQDGFWLLNARLFLGSADGRWRASLMGRNLGDELYVVTSGGRPFASADNNTLLPGGVGLSDTVLNYARGRQVFLQFDVQF